MNATSSAGAAMAASGIEKVRPSYGRGTQAARDARLRELLAAHLRGGGTINAFARIHRMHTGAVGALRASLPPMGPVATSGRAKGSITAATRAKMDALADRVADQLDADVTRAGAALGWPQQSTSRVWGLIRRDLGKQAV